MDHLDKAYQEMQLHAEETIPEAKMTDNAVTFLKAEKDGSLKLQKMERVNGIYVVVNDA